jgi:hypothetical protein
MNVTTLKKLWSGWLCPPIGIGSYLMIPFLDFVLINTHITHASYDQMLCDSTEVAEATIPFHREATLEILQSFHDKG